MHPYTDVNKFCIFLLVENLIVCACNRQFPWPTKLPLPNETNECQTLHLKLRMKERDDTVPQTTNLGLASLANTIHQGLRWKENFAFVRKIEHSPITFAKYTICSLLI